MNLRLVDSIIVRQVRSSAVDLADEQRFGSGLHGSSELDAGIKCDATHAGEFRVYTFDGRSK